VIVIALLFYWYGRSVFDQALEPVMSGLWLLEQEPILDAETASAHT